MAKPVIEKKKGPTYTDEQVRDFTREYVLLDRTRSEAALAVANLCRRAKKSGVPVKQAIAVYKDSQRDPEDVKTELRDYLRVAALRNMPTTQSDLFGDNPIAKLSKAELEAVEAHDAEQRGYLHGLNGGKFDDNPFKAGTENHVKWVEGWHAGQAKAVLKMHDKSSEKEEKASTRRSRKAADATPQAENAAATRKARAEAGVVGHA